MNDTRKIKAVAVFREHGGVLKTSKAMAFGIHPETLYALRDEGVIQKLSRGVFCLSDSNVLYNPGLTAAAVRVPRGVVCLISALAFHEITTQIPHAVSVAIPRRMRRPSIDSPPMEFHRFSEASFAAGVEKHEIEGIEVKVYSPAKTVVDCFKFRNLVGMDVAVEAMRFALERKRISPANIMEYARTCRVQKVITPYLEAIF